MSYISTKEDELKDPSEVPVSQSAETLAANTRETAFETIKDLYDFSIILENLSCFSAELLGEPDFQANFSKLIDGLDAFTQGVSTVKRVLKIGVLPGLDILEADLLSILQDLLDSQQKNLPQYASELLKEHLPLNLKQWREEGIPGLARSRDS
jgi:hypothetical protein